MAVIAVPYNAPKYCCLSTDIDGETSKVTGISVRGAFVYVIDTKKWYVVGDDTALVEIDWGFLTA